MSVGNSAAVLRVRFARTGIAHEIVVEADDGGERRLTVAIPGSDATPPPVVNDAAAVAALPLAMRAGLPLHVQGPLSQGAMRDLSEMAQAWAQAGRHGLANVPITADRIVTGLSPAPGHAALVAWQNDLSSTAMLAAHATGAVQGGFAVRAALRLTGLGSGGAGLREAEAGAAALGLPLLAVESNAAAAGFVDPALGHAPLLAAMLQLAAPCFPGVGTGLIARPFRYDALLHLKRPGPAVPDVLGSDTCAIRFHGGGEAPPALARLVARHPALAASLATAEPRALAAADLAFAASGLPVPWPIALPRRVATILSLPLWRDAEAAEARALDAAWEGPRGIAGTLLGLRLGLDRGVAVAADHLRWGLALAGLRRPWPR